MLRPDTLALTVLLSLLTAVGPLSTDMYLPSLPEIGRVLQAPAAAVQLTISSYLIGFAAGQVLYGPFSDRHGRKPVLLGALAIYSLASLVCALANSIELLTAARFFQAFGGSGGIVLARAVVRDLYSGARAGRELSRMGAIMALAPVVAPLIGGVLQTVFGWRSVFVTLVLFGLSAAVIAWRLLPETLPRRAPEKVSARAILRVYRWLAGHRAFVVDLGIASLAYAGLFAWISGAAFVLQDLYGLSPFNFGIAFALGSVGFMGGASLAARLVGRIGLDRTIGFGALALAAGGLATMLALALGLRSATSLVLPVALYLAGLGMAMPQAIARAMSPFPERAGAASSLIGLVQLTSAALVGAIVGHMLGDSAWPLALAMAATGSLALLLWLAARLLAPRAG